jgi:hypothetical protein
MTAFMLGMPTLIELPLLAASVDLCRRLGLSFIELHADLPSCSPTCTSTTRTRTATTRRSSAERRNRAV